MNPAGVFFFTWLLVGGGFQVSDTFPTWSDCESSRLEMLATGLGPQGRAVEKTYTCQRLR